MNGIPISQEPTASQFSFAQFAQSLRYERIPLDRLVLPDILFPGPEAPFAKKPDESVSVTPLLLPQPATARSQFLTVAKGTLRFVGGASRIAHAASLTAL
jgi:hypothetical protein